MPHDNSKSGARAADRPAATSTNSPLRIATVPCRAGQIGMTLCPGKTQDQGLSGKHRRDLAVDIAAIRAWGASTVVTLVESYELNWLHVPDLPEVVKQSGMDWIHLPIPDQQAPGGEFTYKWAIFGPRLHARLDAGEQLLLHCMGGLGRTGTVAAQLMIECGTEPALAIATVRAARPGAIETRVQEDYLAALGATCAAIRNAAGTAR